ncbi:hypothetical protein ACJMK2_008442 [Sinanodonta woodiana]|uniref:Uncharacterized protein n=1 Tax=Sinanodonta woodiana TaxID=1069815 RepID=A0ABD3VPX3_SINWO
MTRRLSLNPNLSDVIANLAADRNGLDSVAALLDGDRRAPSNNDILDRSASRSRMVGPTSMHLRFATEFLKYPQRLFNNIFLLELKYSSMYITQ